MAATDTCPRCDAVLFPPDVMRSHHRCAVHGVVPPRQSAVLLDTSHLPLVTESATVPVYLPWPLPPKWMSAGIQQVRDPEAGAVAVATGVTGQALTYGPADLVIVSEQPGVGLGANLAGLSDSDPGHWFTDRPADTKIRSGHRFTPLWSLPAIDRSVYVGESDGCWIWLIAWPESAWSVIHDDLRLIDLRNAGPEVDIPAGSISPRLLS
jgi:hypothetical protein